MKVNESLKGAEQLNACNEVLKKLKGIIEDTFDGIVVPLSRNEVMSYNELLHFREMNVKYLDKRIKKIEKELEKLRMENEMDWWEAEYEEDQDGDE